MERCHGESYCKQFNPERSNCHEFCIGYIQLQNIYALSNMPKRYQHEVKMGMMKDDPDYAVFKTLGEWRKNVVQNVKDGKGLFLISKTKGNGKTTWACKMMNEYFRHVALRNNLRCRGLFVNVPEFLRDLKASFDNPSDEFFEFMESIKTADMVVWDDIGTETPTPFVRDTLYVFINHRESNGLTNIYTSNVDIETMEQPHYLGDRITSRIQGQCDLIEFRGIDRRVNK